MTSARRPQVRSARRGGPSRHGQFVVGVASEAEVEAMVTRTVEALGRLDILFNNAGNANYMTGQTLVADGGCLAK